MKDKNQVPYKETINKQIIDQSMIMMSLTYSWFNDLIISKLSLFLN